MRRHPYPEDPNHSFRSHREPNARSSIDRSKVRTLTLLTDRRVIVTIVVAVDARHAACIIDDIGIESIDRVLSSRSPIVVVPTTPRPPLKRMIGHSGTPSVYLPPSTSMGVLTINYIGVMMYLILYTCVRVRNDDAGRDGRTIGPDRIG